MASPPGRVARLAAWERRTDVPLIVLSLLFLGAFTVIALAPGLPRVWHTVFRAVLLITWALFLVDFAVRFALAPRRGAYLAKQVLNLAILLIPPLAPLRVVGMLSRAGIAHRGRRLGVRAQTAWYAMLTTTLLGFSASLSALIFERNAPGSTITTFGDALWWTASTMTTTGYGDTYPVTWQGRLVGSVLMLSGIGLFGVVTASFTAWFVSRFDEDPPA
ncbi:potassium channel family protein [Sinosporangium siamense]|uniref:Potassium channel domain-containing protein n=1 Tax=Sinosporangium siamense TaxID=1367973 RepID=A0A919RKR2_9ACTN|nr:potassium channel family protein [Sinosporangium siamense]GII95617.1 hypothetical protein Ssi02_58480 [Sinosporangium siamense]